jgi:hypothetical protein
MLPAIPAENFHRRVTRLNPFLMPIVDFELILSSECVFATHEMMRPFKTKNSTNYLEPNDGNEQKNSRWFRPGLKFIEQKKMQHLRGLL